MADVKISELPSGTANASAIVPATNAAGTTTQKVTLGGIRDLAHASNHQTGGSDAIANVVVSPSQITANQNNYTPSAGDVVRLSSDAARTITGLSAGADGAVRVLVNVGSFTITLAHQSASSDAANRFLVSFGADYLLAANAAAVAIYDNTTARWRIV